MKILPEELEPGTLITILDNHVDLLVYNFNHSPGLRKYYTYDEPINIGDVLMYYDYKERAYFESKKLGKHAKVELYCLYGQKKVLIEAYRNYKNDDKPFVDLYGYEIKTL